MPILPILQCVVNIQDNFEQPLSYMREVLDPLAPESLRPSFKAAFRQLQRGKALEEMVFFKGG